MKKKLLASLKYSLNSVVGTYIYNRMGFLIQKMLQFKVYFIILTYIMAQWIPIV